MTTSNADFINSLREIVESRDQLAITDLRSNDPRRMAAYIGEHLENLDKTEREFRSKQARLAVAYLVSFMLSGEWMGDDALKNFGSSVKKLQKELDPEMRGIIDKHFIRLLKSKNEIPHREFEYFMRLFTQYKIRVNWLQLLENLRLWNNDPYFREKWAEACWLKESPALEAG